MMDSKENQEKKSTPDDNGESDDVKNDAQVNEGEGKAKEEAPPESDEGKQSPQEEAQEATEEKAETNGVDPAGLEEDDPNLDISDSLKKAMEEAEECISDRDQQNAEVIMSDEVEIETPDKGFDPNVVEEVEAEAPAPPSPKEIELKMQVIDLQHKLREKDNEIEEKVKELKQNLNQARHIQKQFDGYKIRVQKEKADWFNYGHEPLLKELLAVIDNLERALDVEGDMNIKTLREGIELTLRLFMGVLDKFSVKKVEALGQQFDPEFHQAMSRVEDDEVPNNTVVHLHQKGYLLKDRLLRAAMVVVSHTDKPEPEPEETSDAETDDEGSTGDKTNEPETTPAVKEEKADNNEYNENE